MSRARFSRTRRAGLGHRSSRGAVHHHAGRPAATWCRRSRQGPAHRRPSACSSEGEHRRLATRRTCGAGLPPPGRAPAHALHAIDGEGRAIEADAPTIDTAVVREGTRRESDGARDRHAPPRLAGRQAYAACRARRCSTCSSAGHDAAESRPADGATGPRVGLLREQVRRGVREPSRDRIRMPMTIEDRAPWPGRAAFRLSSRSCSPLAVPPAAAFLNGTATARTARACGPARCEPRRAPSLRSSWHRDPVTTGFW